MNSKYLFTNYDLLDYEKASKKAIIYLNNMLNIYCKDKPFGWMIADRIKSLDSINEKIRKKYDEKGKNFDYRIDLLDIAGLRVVFCDKNYVCPCMEDLDYNIHSWTPDEFKCAFDDSKMCADNYDVSNLYDFVEYLMRECKKTAIVKDYIINQKESGYQSLHVIIMVPIESYSGSMRKIPVEIQLRNYTQHLYNECEHMRYKNIYKDMSDYNDVFNEAKRFLLSVANDTYIDILEKSRLENKSYFLIREN